MPVHIDESLAHGAAVLPEDASTRTVCAGIGGIRPDRGEDLENFSDLFHLVQIEMQS